MRMLERWGHNAVLAENGRQVLELLPNEEFDLILMDVQMPDMDGYEATRTIRRAERNAGRHIPIIAMTAHAIRGDKEKCLEAGMDEYLSKPISSTKLMNLLEMIATEKALKARPKDAVEKPRSKLDRQMLRDAFDQDWDFFKEIVDLFISDYPRMIEVLQDAIEKGDAAALRRSAHSLKGMVNLFQADDVVRMALRLEDKGKNNDFSGVDQEIERLETALAKLKDTLLDLSSELSAKDRN
jgi:CheY-like chemotaxis protein